MGGDKVVQFNDGGISESTDDHYCATDTSADAVWVNDCPTLHPSGLLESQLASEGSESASSSAAAPDQPCWWLCRTKPRQEKVVARHFFARGMQFYLPLIERKSLTRGRPRSAYVPLFDGYVFLHGDAYDRLAALETNRLAQVFEVPDSEVLVRDLAQFAQLIASDQPLIPYRRIEPGNRVRIKSGPFAGIEGSVLRWEGKTHLQIVVHCIQQGALLKVEDYKLESLD